MSFPATVSAIGINKTGGFEVGEKVEVPFPTQKPNQILVKVSVIVKTVVEGRWC